MLSNLLLCPPLPRRRKGNSPSSPRPVGSPCLGGGSLTLSRVPWTLMPVQRGNSPLLPLSMIQCQLSPAQRGSGEGRKCSLHPTAKPTSSISLHGGIPMPQCDVPSPQEGFPEPQHWCRERIPPSHSSTQSRHWQGDLDQPQPGGTVLPPTPTPVETGLSQHGTMPRGRKEGGIPCLQGEQGFVLPTLLPVLLSWQTQAGPGLQNRGFVASALTAQQGQSCLAGAVSMGQGQPAHPVGAGLWERCKAAWDARGLWSNLS